jgi:hypothetical protein
MKAKIRWLMGSPIGFALLVGAVQNLDANEFYKGKTIRFVVGFGRWRGL